MNWFSITMYARARKKGIIASGKPDLKVEVAPLPENTQTTQLLHSKDRTIRLRVEMAKEIA